MPKNKKKLSALARSRRNLKRIQRMYLTGVMVFQYDRGQFTKAFLTHHRIKSL